MDKGFIIGMDLGTLMLLTTVFLFFKQVYVLYLVLIIGFIIDIAARLTELRRNMKREGLQ